MRNFVQGFARSRSGLVGLGILIVIVAFAVMAPVLFPRSPFEIVGAPFQPPFGNHLLGTDSLGRSVAAGLAHGAQNSLFIGVFATAIAISLGVLVGGLAGYFGGWLDDVLMRSTEFFQTIPAFIFAIVLIALLSPSLHIIVIAIGVVSWPPVARLVRGEFMTLRSRDFVSASICLGSSDLAIITRDILPNSLSPIIVTASLMVATAILTESALAFLGLGDPNVMSWGFMIGSGRPFLRDAWWLCAIPGLAIFATVNCINFVGEGLNDALNPSRASKL